MERNYREVGEEPNKWSRMIRELGSLAAYLLVAVVATYLIVQFVGQRTQVLGSSMESTLSDGENLIMDKITYRFREPERFEVIIFPYQHDRKTHYIKRIIGLPGETVQIQGGVIYINGAVLEENYGREVMRSAGEATFPITLGPDEYFVLGDNRNNSSDSRDPSVGLIKRQDIMGRAWLRVWPLSKFGFVSH